MIDTVGLIDNCFNDGFLFRVIPRDAKAVWIKSKCHHACIYLQLFFCCDQCLFSWTWSNWNNIDLK